MVVEDDGDRDVGRIGAIDAFEKADELARAMALLAGGVDLAGQEVDAGEQAERTVTHVLVIACRALVPIGDGRQVVARRADRLDARLLVVGENRHVGRLAVSPAFFRSATS